ncbi:MAG: PASTA domain-containing protein, partial [Accumulibacter sp.]|uniref:PASTA domain-containing protein n=1 Tax=Accumulibacter sp. TaxID=2053492 RepID=UPI00331644B4
SVTQQASTTVPSGTVISQSPTAGASITPGSAVDLVVSSGPVPVTVPNVVGMTQSAATSTITEAGLTVGQIIQQVSETVPVGTVIRQNPVAGTSVQPGSAVDLVISSGDPIPIPPTGVSASDGTFFDRVRVTWNSVSGATYYEVYKSALANSLGTLLGQSTGTSFDDTNIYAGLSMYYSVKACNSTGCSDFSNFDLGYPGTLTAPQQLAPPDGSIFDNYPRTTTVQWQPVPLAESYNVEVDCYDCCRTGAWCTDIGATWVIYTGIRSGSFTFDFVGAQPGRWRVWAVASGVDGPKSGWWTFYYTR